MYKSFMIVMAALLLLVGCGDDSKVRVIADLEKATVFVDNKALSQVRIGYATLMLASGEHTIKVEKLSSDGEWLYHASKTVTISSDKTNYVELETIKKDETQKRKDRIAQEEKAAKELAEKIAREAAEKKKRMWESSEVVEDEKFDIIWQNIMPEEKMRQVDAVTYCENLKFAKMEQWRLPTIGEALSISNQEKLKYKGTLLTSDSRRSGGYNYPRYVFKNNRVDHSYDSVKLDFLCVKDKPEKEANKISIAKKLGFDSYPNNLFFDEKNKLVWENKTYFADFLYRSKAVEYCRNLNSNGIKNWRLPTRDELVNLHTTKPAYANITYSTFISSTPAKKNYNYTVAPNGNIGVEGSSLAYYYRCVKDIGKEVKIQQSKTEQAKITVSTPKNVFTPSQKNELTQKKIASFKLPQTFEETSAWRALIEVSCLDKNKVCGKVDFRALKCGADLFYVEERDSIYRFKGKITYGQCVNGCEIRIDMNTQTYGEYCAGRRTGGGKLNLY